MVLWRISDYADLIGRTGEVTTGRWHTKAYGKRIVYLAEHPALSLIEVLVNLRGDPEFYPDTFQLLRITVTVPLEADVLTPVQLSRVDPNNLASTQRMGDAWLAGRSSALLRVPSIPSPESWIYLLDPLHLDAAKLSIEWARNLSYDRRLFHLGP